MCNQEVVTNDSDHLQQVKSSTDEVNHTGCEDPNVKVVSVVYFTYNTTIGVGDGGGEGGRGRGHVPPPPPLKFWKSIFWAISMKKSGIFAGKNHVKFRNFVNFSGKYNKN